MKKNSLEPILYSTIGIAAMALVLVAINFIGTKAKVRVDLTEEKAYTLSKGSKAILDEIDGKVKIRFYLTRKGTASPETVYLKSYARRVEDLLDEYRQNSNGHIVIEKYDPEPDSDAEDSARLDGIEGQMLSTGERFYLGLAVSQLDATETIPFLSPNRERQLEYDISRAISRVSTTDKPVVGVMSGLPVFGSPPNPMMAQMGQQPQGQEPWAIITDLKRDYDVREIDMDVDEIEDDVTLLMVIHPKDISEKGQFAIDQFVMRGGKLLAFVDSMCLADRSNQNPMMGGMGGGSSTLDKLFDAWGIGFDKSKTVADVNFMMKVGGRGGQPQTIPTLMQLTPLGINRDDIITSQLDNIWIPFGGALTGTPAEGLEKTILFHSSTNSQLVDGFMASMSSESVLKDFKPSNTEYALAMRLTGKFKTAFPDGAPKDSSDAGDTSSDDESKDGEAADAKPASLQETEGDNAVVVVGDADMLSDQFTMQRLRSPFGTLIQLLNGNLPFAQNAVEQMSGNQNLIAVRSRSTLSRPFLLVKQMEADAQERYRSRIKELEDSLAETERRLNELQRNKDEGQRFILSPEQQAEIETFRKKQVEVNKQLKQERKNLRREIDSLEVRLKWINIAAVPFLVTLTGVGLAFWKRKHTGAR